MSPKLFNVSNFEDELYRSMENTLIKNQAENTHGFNKLARAIELLNTAASIFDQAGMLQEAVDITSILNALAKDING
jgi:hypothetical protein